MAVPPQSAAPKKNMSKVYTLGIDVSLWQTDDATNIKRHFDPHVAKEHGIQFAFIKASERLGKDPAVEHFQQAFKDAGIPRGFYHFARYSQLSTQSAQKQAEHFWNVIKDYEAELPPVLDLEDPPGMEAIGMSWIQRFLYTLRDLCGKNPIIYTSPSYWNKIGAANEAVSNWVLEFPLWIANYWATALPFPVRGIPDIVYTTTTMPTMPELWKKNNKTFTFWQFSQTGDGVYYGGQYPLGGKNSALDLNVYNGSLFDLYAQFGIEDEVPEEPDPPVPPEPQPQYVRVIAKQADGKKGWLFFRSRPEIYSGDGVAVGYGVKLKLLSPEPINGMWHVTIDEFEGYVSAGTKYTELV
ncbi:MAG: glycoside hydrolase family 25 protein [Anaerolineales bacterium]|nr:glycoside hydrolase family 25 protein [Anaerolineales bacterium]